MYELQVKALGLSKGYDFTNHDLSWLDTEAFSSMGWVLGCNAIDDAIYEARKAKNKKAAKHYRMLFATIDAVMGY